MVTSPLVLAIDTSTTQACLGLVRDGAVLAETRVPVQGKNGETLLLHMKDTLAKAGVALAQTELIVVGLGPGSFTGLRIALATARAFAIALNKPIVGVGTLDAIAWSASQDGELVAAVIDAHKDRIYGALYRRSADALQLLIEPTDIDARAFAQLVQSRGDASHAVVAGNALERYLAPMQAELGENTRFAPEAVPDVRALATLGLQRFLASGGQDALSLEPQYVRPSDALLPHERA